MKVKIATTNDEYNDALLVRRQVFIEEQQVSEEEEIDNLENEATHFVLYDHNQPIGAGRIRQLENTGKVERICVLSTSRKKGSGKMIMDKIEQYAIDQGIDKLKLNSQTHAEQFYKKLGYETVSEVFMDAGIPHVTMVKQLT
ncbi:GNAT family N-acetyltransferase [Cytobacillus sp. Hm23]